MLLKRQVLKSLHMIAVALAVSVILEFKMFDLKK